MLYSEHTVAATEDILVFTIGFGFIQPDVFVNQVFEFVGCVLREVDITGKAAIFLLAHNYGILPVAVQAQNFNSFSIIKTCGEFYFAIVFRFVISFLYHVEII